IDASRDDGLLRIVRQGVLSEETIRELVGDDALTVDAPEAEPPVEEAPVEEPPVEEASAKDD
ncbi:MAG: hypothetical protein ACTJHM_04215, partial [Agrococcus casei]